MKTGTNLEQELQRLTACLGRLASDHGCKLVQKYVGAVKVGDYLVYETSDYEQDPAKEEGFMKRVEHLHCRRVVATGGEQGSGPTPGQNWLAMEGDKEIRKYGDRRDDVVLVIEPPAEGMPAGTLTMLEGNG